MPCKVAVMHTWGELRAWTLSGHFHETDKHNLIHINEALSGLPVDVKFVSFEDVENGALEGVDVVINAGRAGDAWSGGDAWKSEKLLAAVTKFVYEGGSFIGVGEPSAVAGYDTYFRLANVLGIDEDTGARVCHGRWQAEQTVLPVAVDETVLQPNPHLYLTDGKARVLAQKDGVPVMTVNDFGKGKAVYMSSFRVGANSTRMLLELLAYLSGAEKNYLSDNALVECAYYPADKTLVALNNSEEAVMASIQLPEGKIDVELQPMETRMIQL